MSEPNLDITSGKVLPNRNNDGQDRTNNKNMPNIMKGRKDVTKLRTGTPMEEQETIETTTTEMHKQEGITETNGQTVVITENEIKAQAVTEMKTQVATEMHKQAAAHLRAADNLLAAAAQYSSGARPTPYLLTASPGLWIPMEDEEEHDKDYSEEENLLPRIPKYKMVSIFRKDESCCKIIKSLFKYILALVLSNTIFGIIGVACSSVGVLQFQIFFNIIFSIIGVAIISGSLVKYVLLLVFFNLIFAIIGVAYIWVYKTLVFYLLISFNIFFISIGVAVIGQSLVKYILLLFNIIFAIIGMTVIGLGAYIKIRPEYYMDLLGIGEYLNVPIILGLVIFIIAIFGCIGALKKPIMLYIHAVLHFAIIIAEIGIILIMVFLCLFVYETDTYGDLAVIVKGSMQFYSHNDWHAFIIPLITWMWDFVQRTVECCGWIGPSDWTNTTFGHIPCSCRVEEQVLDCRDDLKVEFFSQGCNEMLEEKLSGPGSPYDIIGKISIIFTCIALLQLTMILCSCCNATTKMYPLDKSNIHRQQKCMECFKIRK